MNDEFRFPDEVTKSFFERAKNCDSDTDSICFFIQESIKSSAILLANVILTWGSFFPESGVEKDKEIIVKDFKFHLNKLLESDGPFLSYEKKIPHKQE